MLSLHGSKKEKRQNLSKLGKQQQKKITKREEERKGNSGEWKRELQNRTWTKGRKKLVEAEQKRTGEKKEAVEITGFEPVASRMQSERSTTELYPRLALPGDKTFS